MKVVKTARPEVDFEKFKTGYRRLLRTVAPIPLPGAVPLLQHLYERHVMTLVVSAGPREAIVGDLGLLGVRQFVRHVWGFEDTVYSKPDLRVLADPLG